MERIAHKIEEKERTEDVQLKETFPFSKMLLSDHVRKGINQAGFVYPTKIQANAIPLGKSGIDLLIQSKSGTGKTLIFSVILLEAYRNDIREPQSLVLAPTREIAVQIESILNQIGKFCQAFKAVSLIGGLNINEDRKKVQGAKAIVGTPGRVLHLIKNDVLNTSKIKLLILDEADKLMNGTFRQDLEKISKSLASKKQVVACSATFCDDLDKALAKYMRNPLLISTDKRATLLIGIKQFVYEIPEEVNSVLEMNAKIAAINKIFSKISFKQCLAFSSSQSRAESYRNLLERNDWPCEVISGAQDQKIRLEIFKKFREFKTRILVSTDLMSRGIDSEYVNLVVNLEVPENGPTYLHRIGRAGRFGSHGIAITFLSSKKDKIKFSQILNDIGNNMAVLKFPTEEIPDLWNFSNLSEEQKAFGLFERISCSDEEIEKQDENGEKIQNCHVNDVDNLKIPTDSLSSSSQKQHSVNATTLDDASSLAVDSDIHLDVPNVASNRCVPEKKTSASKSKRSKSKEQKKKSECVVEIHVNRECQSQKAEKKSSSSKQKSEKLKQNHEKPKENVAFEDESNEVQSDVGNSSGGDTRTIIDFKSLVVDKEKAALKTAANDIFADYETFKEKPSDNESKSKSENKNESISNPSSNNVFDDYDNFKEDQSENTNNVEHTAKISPSTSNQSESIPQNSTNKENDKSIISIDLPKAPHPSPRELKLESTRSVSNFAANNNQVHLNKLQIQNLPSFDLPPRNDHPELDTSNEDDDDDNEDYTSTSSAMNTRSSGFDEKTTSLASSGIVTSTEYSESEDSYQETSGDDDEEDDEYFETTEESEEDSSSSSDIMDQYSIDESELEEEDEDNEVKSNLEEASPPAASDENVPENLEDLNYRYQQAYSLWTNIYWNQLTQIRDYAKFWSYVRQHADEI